MHKTLLPLLLGLGLMGCAARPKTPTVTDASAATSTPATSTARTERAAEDADRDGQAALIPLSLDPVYFELDSATLRPEFRQTLEQLADGLRQRPGTRVTVSGHTCELGTTEYNLALGQRRAAVVRDYLRRLGVDASRIRTLSFGEERPLDDSHSEEAQNRNRRAEFSFSSDDASRGSSL
ncbi:OmpA family protein [Pyxidicoccus fallax]|uniref:Peptidoglycan-associated lipoprotein n=1 Tax=Pyxidicoccus fallax TaxID=394095 RepID=A0A848LFD3_9BACT|nr:OmpA family protein [Pyxidicoccus fallax]NMO15021.1 OmpA family protein [Pyxidicoccus fallax]NPC82653.1 OmpA family protein [Pyxidicoccus fallax]